MPLISPSSKNAASSLGRRSPLCSLLKPTIRTGSADGTRGGDGLYGSKKSQARCGTAKISVSGSYMLKRCTRSQISSLVVRPFPPPLRKVWRNQLGSQRSGNPRRAEPEALARFQSSSMDSRCTFMSRRATTCFVEAIWSYTARLTGAAYAAWRDSMLKRMPFSCSCVYNLLAASMSKVLLLAESGSSSWPLTTGVGSGSSNDTKDTLRFRSRPRPENEPPSYREALLSGGSTPPITVNEWTFSRHSSVFFSKYSCASFKDDKQTN